MATTLNQTENTNLIKDAITGLSNYPMFLNTVTFRLLMLIDLPTDWADRERFKATIPTKNYIAVYGANNGNNSGAYLSIKKAVMDLKAVQFFKSVVYTNINGNRTTFTEIEFDKSQINQLARFLKIVHKSKLTNFSKLRSNHAVRFYLFLNYVLKQSKPLNNGKAIIHFNAKEMRKIFGVSDKDYVQMGNFWSLILRLCNQVTSNSNITIFDNHFVGQTSHKEMFLTIGYKNLKD